MVNDRVVDWVAYEAYGSATMGNQAAIGWGCIVQSSVALSKLGEVKAG